MYVGLHNHKIIINK